jgi:hypothetical protein
VKWLSDVQAESEPYIEVAPVTAAAPIFTGIYNLHRFKKKVNRKEKCLKG